MLRVIRVASAALWLMIAAESATAASCGAPSRVTPQMVAAMVDSVQVLTKDFADSLVHGPRYAESRVRLDAALRRLRDLAVPAPTPGLKTVLRLGELPAGSSPIVESTFSLCCATMTRPGSRA